MEAQQAPHIVLQRSEMTSVKGPYVLLKVASSREDQFTIAVWDVAPDMPPKIGEIVYFRPGSIRDNGDRKSCSKPDLTCRGIAEESHPLYDLIPRPIKREEWNGTIENLLTYCTDEKEIGIIKEWGGKLFDQYIQFPAANNVHHAFPGGLLNHTHQMLKAFEGLYPCLPYKQDVKPERVILGIIFHDFGKMCEYDIDGKIQEDMALLGHIYIGTAKLQNIMLSADIDWEETKRTIHCILAHHGQREYGAPVLPCTQEAVIIYLLDNLSAKADMIHNAANMEKLYALGTNVVK